MCEIYALLNVPCMTGLGGGVYTEPLCLNG